MPIQSPPHSGETAPSSILIVGWSPSSCAHSDWLSLKSILNSARYGGRPSRGHSRCVFLCCRLCQNLPILIGILMRVFSTLQLSPGPIECRQVSSVGNPSESFSIRVATALSLAEGTCKFNMHEMCQILL